MILLLPSSQYIMISFYLVTSRNKDPVAASFKHVYKNSYESFLYFFYPFVVTQILLTVCKKNKKNKKQKTKEQIIILVFTSIFFCLGGRFGVSLVFYTIWCFLIIYSWSNLHLNINFLLSHYHRRLKLIANTLLFDPE